VRWVLKALEWRDQNQISGPISVFVWRGWENSENLSLDGRSLFEIWTQDLPIRSKQCEANTAAAWWLNLNRIVGTIMFNCALPHQQTGYLLTKGIKYMERTQKKTNSKQLSPSREAVSCSANQESPNIVYNSKVHYRVHKSHALVPILYQINPVRTNSPYLTSILILSSRSLLLSGFTTNVLHEFFFSLSYHIPCPSHPPWLDHSNYIWRHVQVSV
jgi:hypothetical protein